MKYEEHIIELDGHSAKFRCYIPSESPDCAYKGARPAVVVLPGGAYFITYEGEAEQIALKMCAEGICAFVLDYATAPSGKIFPTALAQALCAVKRVRASAQEYGIDRNNISILGFSAGGHLCSCVGTLWNNLCLDMYLKGDREEYKANKMILCYPVISTDEAITHKASLENLTGKSYDNLTADEKQLLSTEKNVGKHTPPTFIWTTAEDNCVCPQNSLAMAKALADNKIPFELYLYPHGEHGLGSADRTSRNIRFGDELECAEWMKKAVRFIYDTKMI